MPRFSSFNTLLQREQFPDIWIWHHKVLKISFIPRLFIIPYYNMGYKANTLSRNKHFIEVFILLFLQKELSLVFFYLFT